MIPGCKIGRKRSWNHEVILPPWPAPQYHSQVQAGSRRQKERTAGDSNQDHQASVACFKEPRSFSQEKRRLSEPRTVCCLFSPFPQRKTQGFRGAGNTFEAVVEQLIPEGVHEQCNQKIFWGLIRLVEGVTLIALEGLLSLSFPRFSSSSNCRGSARF